MADAPLTLDLILRGRIAGQPLTLVGTLKDGKLAQVSGLVTVDKSLEEFLKSLGGFDEAGATLRGLTPDSGIKFGSLAFGYHSVDPKFAQVAMTFSLGGSRCRFVCLKQFGTPGWYAAGLELRLDKDLFKNNWLSGLIGEISLGDLAIYFASEKVENVAYDPDQGFQAAGAIGRAVSPPLRNFTKGVNWSANVSIGKTKLLDWPGKTRNTTTPGLTAASETTGQKAASTKPEDSTTWIDLDKSLGPVTVRRIGLAYEAPKIGVKFDASLQLSVLTLTLDGLGMSYPLNKFGDFVKNPTDIKSIFRNLEFSLDGMGLAFGKGPVEIGGSLLCVKKVPLELEGTLLIRTAAFSLSAMALYKDLNGTPSVVAYAVLLYAIGGDPAFFITGLAFGFGVNRRLTLPPIEEVQNFPLIQAAMGKQGFTDKKDLPAKLRDYVKPVEGSYWVAAGVKFTSYAMIESFVLLSVSFGLEVEIGLLGLSRMSVPPPGTETLQPIACAELALRAVIRPADGVFALEGRLTSESYIFSKSCRLTGGFAFCIWFKGPLAGDFVVTLGGYHPKFKRLPHYPIVPRLGVNWQVTTELAITAEMYFALTPSCLMAGGKLSAVYRSSSIKAWFIAYADFLLNWKPFYYTADMGVSIGVEADVGLFVIKLHLSVQIHLWGPEFAGEIEVDLTIFTFTVRFGPPKTAPVPLKSEEFVAAFLPASSPVIVSSCTGGLIREVERVATKLRVVNGHALELTIQSKIPATGFLGPILGQIPDSIQEKLKGGKQDFGIKPMGKKVLDSNLNVSIDGLNGANNLKFELIEIGVPEALWGTVGKEGAVPLPKEAEAKIVKANAGLRIWFEPKEPLGALPAMPIREFAFEEIKQPIPWNLAIKPAEPYKAGDVPDINPEIRLAYLANVANVAIEPAKTKRPAILDVLAYQSPFELNQVDLRRLADDRYRLKYFQQDPQQDCPTGGAFK